MNLIKKSFLLSLMIIAIAFTLVSCGKPKGNQTKIELSAVKNEVSVQLGEKVELQFAATENDTYKQADVLANLNYESSDKAVVNVENEGLVAVGVGSATITATWKEDTTVQATVKVNVLAPEVSEVTFTGAPEKIYVGEYFVIEYVAQEDVNVTFTSSNAEVLACEENKFDGVAAGTATITAVASNGYKEKEYKWDVVVEKGEFAITYVLDGGKNATSNPDKYDISNLPLTLGKATKTNKTFAGWSLVEGSDEYITEIPAGTTGDITLYANYKDIVRKITYNLDGGVLPEEAPTSFVQGEGVALVNPTKEGYNFLGWKTAATAVTYVTEIKASQKTDVNLYAAWEKIPVYSNIAYELNDGVLPEGAATQYEEGVELVLPVPTKEGFIFLGWTKEVSSENYVKVIPASQTGTFKVYAQWQEKPAVAGKVYVGEGKDYATLDEAIQGAMSGSIIVLAAGEYSLSVVIDKNFTIVGPNADLEVSQFSTEEALINVAKDVAGNLAAQSIVFNGVHLKGTGGGGGIPGITFQDGGSVEYLEFTSCVISDTNTFIKFVGGTSSMNMVIKNSHIHTIGQFVIWTTTSLKKLTLMGNLIQGSTCGAVTNENAALFRLRAGELEALGNYFDGDSLNVPGYFELSDAAGKSVVKYNTFNNVTRFVFTTKDNNAVFNQNLYLDYAGKALTAAPKQLAANGLTADATVCASEEERAMLYNKELTSQNPDRYFTIEYDLAGGELTSAAPGAYDKEAGIANLPTVEKEGYIFVGWYLNGELVDSIAVGTSGNIKLVAKWREPALIVDGTNEEGHYETLAAALAAVKPGETIKVVAGEWDETVTVNVANVTILGPNAGVAGTATRNTEAVIKGVINVTSEAQNLTIDGLAFTGAAKIVYAESKDYEGFVFQNNNVYDTTESAKAWDESRYSLPGFLQFTMASGGKLINLQVYNNSFVNVSEVNVLANRVMNMSVDGNLFKDFDLDAIRTDGGYCYGILAFTNNVFEQTNPESGNNGIFLYSNAGSAGTNCQIVIKNNEFIKLGKNNGTVFTGAISAYRYQENPTSYDISNNIFDHCYDYLYLRNNGAYNSTWSCTVENNQFLGLPTNQYYGSYRGSDSESTNPHTAVFTKNYYEDNEGNVITDLSQYASYFKHMASYGEALTAKPESAEIEAVQFWTISYDLNGGTTKEAFVYEYTSLNNAPIALPTVSLTNHSFTGWLLNGQLVTEIPADARGNLNLVAQFKLLEGEVYTIEYVTNKENVVWPSRPAEDRQEIIDALYADLYEWAKGNGETKSYDEYVSYLTTKFAAYEDINLRNTKLGNYPAEDGSTEYFLNIPKYFQKWSEFFAVFHTAMLAVNPDQSFYTDTYATMVRINQFVTWSSTGEKYFNSYLSKMCQATKIPQEIEYSYRGGQSVVLPKISLANGLEFLGWYDNADFTGEPITSITPTTEAGNKVYYAKWAPEVKPESIEINKITEILLFETHQLVWSLTPTNVTDPTVEFFSSNESVAYVSAKGLITTLANGTTTITVKVYGNRELDVVFDLVVYTDDYIDGSFETESYVVVDGSIKLNAEVVYKNGTKGAVNWTSLNPEIATVDANGVVTALNAGEVKIVAEDQTNAKTKLEFVVVVLENDPEGILDLAVRSNESNVFTRYDLNIGSTYTKDILGSVSKLFGNGKLSVNNKYYDASNQSAATYGKMSSIEFITVHYTGNMAAGADANANASYFATNGSTSIHYTTGNDGVYYCMDESKGAWHAGDSGALAEVGEFKWMATGVKVGANDPKYPEFTISTDFYYEINGQKTTVKMPNPWNYSSRGTDHVLNADGTISSKPGYSSTGFTNRTPESFINDQGLPFTIVNGEYYMGTTWWCYTQVYEGRICGTGGNRNSIGIESCVNEGSDLWWTWQLTAQLVADIMVRQNLDITRVRGHHFFSGKNCPQPMLENDQEIWYKFVELVEAEYELLTKYAGYEVSIVSNNPDIVDNDGRVVKQPNATTCVTYTITFTKDGQSQSMTLSSMVKGRYVDR